MKKLIPLLIGIMTVTVPSASILQAQTRPALRKPVASATRLNAARVAPTPTKKVASTNNKDTYFRVGLRLGGNSAKIGGIDVSAVGEGIHLARVTGFHAGAVFTIGGPTFSVQPEILFTQYGVRLASGSDYLQFKYNLVELPILLKVSFGQPHLRFFVNAGPTATYAMSGTLSVRENGQSDSQPIEMKPQERFSFGASGGIGVALKAGPGTVLLEGRYTYLLANHDDGSRTKPQNAMLSVGYLIPLGGALTGDTTLIIASKVRIETDLGFLIKQNL